MDVEQGIPEVGKWRDCPDPGPDPSNLQDL